MRLRRNSMIITFLFLALSSSVYCNPFSSPIVVEKKEGTPSKAKLGSSSKVSQEELPYMRLVGVMREEYGGRVALIDFMDGRVLVVRERQVIDKVIRVMKIEERSVYIKYKSKILKLSL